MIRAGHDKQQTGNDDPLAWSGPGGSGCAPTGAGVLDVDTVCSEALSAIAQSAMIGSIGNQPVRFDTYAASR